MFNVGDEVILNRDYSITKIGDVGIISRIERYGVIVKFHTMAMPNFIGEEFNIPKEDLLHADGIVLSPIERKIKRMYERQSYFLRHRSEQNEGT